MHHYSQRIACPRTEQFFGSASLASTGGRTIVFDTVVAQWSLKHRSFVSLSTLWFLAVIYWKASEIPGEMGPQDF
jgi:hypothetical protein